MHAKKISLLWGILRPPPSLRSFPLMRGFIIGSFFHLGRGLRFAAPNAEIGGAGLSSDRARESYGAKLILREQWLLGLE